MEETTDELKPRREGKMNRQLKQLLFALILVLGLGSLSNTALASCRDIDTNPTWNKQLKEVQAAYKAGDYQKAIQIAQSMSSICADSPALNYYIAKSYSSLNEPTKASFYYERATNNLAEFRVSPETAKQIWYGRYEAEYPELTQKYVDQLKAENLRLSNENSGLIDDKYKTEKSHTITSTVDYNYEKHKASVILWTGVGIGIGGIALASAGIALMLDQDSRYDHSDKSETVVDNDGHEQTYKTDFELTKTKPYIAGLSLLGIGGALTFSGVLMAGIAGYQYNHIKMSDTTELSLDVSLNRISMQLTF